MKAKTLNVQMNKRRVAILLLLLFGAHSLCYLSGQETTSSRITGTVTATNTQEPLIGVSVVVKGTTKGILTDVNGDFELTAPENSILQLSYIGYLPKEVVVKKLTKLSITMDENVELLEEVIVIGYGKVKKGDVTGSLTTITPDQLNKGKQLTAQDALVGKVAGVSVVSGSGKPGDGGTIRIRMGASLSADNDPLIVIDGIPVANTSISSINPNDIESFTVLKDASATAIYGSRASNGVIIITTKKGNTQGGKPQVTYSSTFSASQVGESLKVLDATQYRAAFKEYAGAPDSYQLGEANTDWQKKIYRTAFGTDHNLSLTGALHTMPYRLSGGYTNQSGIIKTSNYERINLGFGLAPTLLDKHLTIELNAKGSIENEQLVPSSIAGGAAGFDPTRPVYETYPNSMGLGYFMFLNDGKKIDLSPTNPISELNLTDNKQQTKRSIGNIAANYKVHGLEALQLNINMGYDIKQNEENVNTPDFAPDMYTSNQNDGTGRAYNKVSDNSNYLLSLFANYAKEIGTKHAFNLMGGYDWQRFWYKTKEKTTDTAGTQLILPTNSEGELYLLSFYGRLNYTYAQKLLLTATLRSDASSRFSKSNRWGYFPSVALAYRLNEEPFLKRIKALSDLKIRLSYGQTGQQDIGSYYQHLGTYSTSYDNSRYQFGSNWITLYRPNGYDPNIKWETTATYNLGIDVGLYNNRLAASIDLYTRKTSDLLNDIFVPAGSNFTNQIATNIGDMKGKGVELSLTAVPIKTKEWEWTISGNFTYNTSEISKLNTIDTEDNYVKTGSAGGTGNYLQVHKVGETPNTFFLLQQAYDAEGKPLDGKYVAKDGTLTTSEADANKYVTGKSSKTPYYYGLSTRLRYKNWDMGINGHGSFGNYIFNYQAAGSSFDRLYSPQGTSANIQQATLKSGFTQDRLYSDYFLERANFFKLDNLTVGYSFSPLFKNTTAIRVAFSAQNIATITNYSGLDPEIYSGIDRNIYQRPRIYLVSLNVNF